MSHRNVGLSCERRCKAFHHHESRLSFAHEDALNIPRESCRLRRLSFRQHSGSNRMR